MTIAAVVFDWAGTMMDFGSIAPVIALRRAFEAECLRGGGPAGPRRRGARGHGPGQARDHIRALLETPQAASQKSLRGTAGAGVESRLGLIGFRRM